MRNQPHLASYIFCKYRLGSFGFLAHPELSAEDEASKARKGPMVAAGSGNYALLDLVAALEWVRDHIRSFGGDPNKVLRRGIGVRVKGVAGSDALVAQYDGYAVVQLCFSVA